MTNLSILRGFCVILMVFVASYLTDCNFGGVSRPLRPSSKAKVPTNVAARSHASLHRCEKEETPRLVVFTRPEPPNGVYSYTHTVNSSFAIRKTRKSSRNGKRIR